MAAFGVRVQQPAAVDPRAADDAATAANRAFSSLNAAFPSTRAFAREILPGVKETPATIDAALPWIAQARPLMGPKELGGLAAQLAPASRDLARVTDAAIQLLPADQPRLAAARPTSCCRPATS